MNLLAKIDNLADKLTVSERGIANYIRGFYPQGALGPAKNIAEQTGASTATVVRFFRKLGYGSYGEVQVEARAEVAVKLASPLARVHVHKAETSTLSAIYSGVYRADVDNLTNAYRMNQVSDFQAFINVITRIDGGRLFLLGAKNSNAVVQYLHTNLILCVPNVIHLPGDVGMQADQVVTASGKDVLFVVSVRRYIQSTVKMAKFFRSVGAKVIAITDREDAPIAQLADSRLLVGMASLSPFDSFIAAFSLCNAITAAIANRRHRDVEHSLERGEKVWDFLQLFKE